MKNINTQEELYDELNKIDKEHTFLHFYVRGKGDFTFIFEERGKTIQEEIEEDEELREMIRKSREEYKEGKYVTTDEIIKSMNEKDFLK